MLYIDPGQRLAVAFLSNLEDARERPQTARAMAEIVADGLRDGERTAR